MLSLDFECLHKELIFIRLTYYYLITQAVTEFFLQLKGDLTSKKFGYVTEGFIDVTAGVKSVIDDTVERMRKAGAVVDEISIPEQKLGMNELMTDAKSQGVPTIKQITQKKYNNKVKQRVYVGVLKGTEFRTGLLCLDHSFCVLA